MTEDIDAAERVAAEIAKLPRCFKLRGFPGDYFRPSLQTSHLNDNGSVTICLEVFKQEGDWMEHTKGTLREILRDMVEINGDMRFASYEEVDLFLGRGEQPDLHLQEKLEEGPPSVSRIINGEYVFGFMVNGEFVPSIAHEKEDEDH